MLIDLTSALMGYDVISGLLRGNGAREDCAARYYESAGIQFLKKHLRRFGGFELSEESLLSFFQHPEKSGVFGKSILSGIRLAPSFNPSVFEGIQEHIASFEGEITAMVGQFLPDGTKEPALSQITVYLLFGIRGTSIVLENEIAVDLCDETLYEDDRLSLRRLKGVIAHEVHHIAVSERFRKFLDYPGSEAQRVKHAIVEGLIGEGIACFYFTPYVLEQNSSLGAGT